jgi:hypothetical protein
MVEHQELRILQYNVQNSRHVVLDDLFKNPRILEYDIQAIQEPWRNPFIVTYRKIGRYDCRIHHCTMEFFQNFFLVDCIKNARTACSQEYKTPIVYGWGRLKRDDLVWVCSFIISWLWSHFLMREAKGRRPLM